jgi:hypothetical protein
MQAHYAHIICRNPRKVEAWIRAVLVEKRYFTDVPDLPPAVANGVQPATGANGTVSWLTQCATACLLRHVR